LLFDIRLLLAQSLSSQQGIRFSGARSDRLGCSKIGGDYGLPNEAI